MRICLSLLIITDNSHTKNPLLETSFNQKFKKKTYILIFEDRFYTGFSLWFLILITKMVLLWRKL